MITLNEENTVLFGEQVGDHVAKLSDLMGHNCGEPFREQLYRKTCFANRLLEGSTRMLGLREWSSTLAMFASLLSKVSESTGCWDENISQIVSEILEMEEQLVVEITEGSIEEAGAEQVFAGLQQEIQVLMEESYDVAGRSVEDQFEQIGQLSLEKGAAFEESPLEERPESGPAQVPSPASAPGRFGTLDRLVSSLEKVNDRYLEYVSGPGDDNGMIRDLELAFGESEFFLGLVGNILRQLGDNSRQFRAKVASRTVLDGVEEFISMNSRLRGWKVDVETKADSFSLEREAASDLA
ncbi:MAG TPA: hypothetical protein VLA34_08980, partial [Candidatus Krumholzibacterium sp.]|nr:hypothetical protein [Candidatus Krumholzibacterium sp.]